MFDDPDHRAGAILDIAAATPPTFEATDGLGDLHRLWPITDPDAVDVLTTALVGSNVTIADGHHRTTTALDYQREQRAAAGPVWTGDEAANYVLAGLIAHDAPGLVILAAHRLVTAEPPTDLVNHLAEHFDVTDLTAELPSGLEGATALLSRVRALAGSPTTLGLIDASATSTDARLLLASARSWSDIEAVMPANLSTASKHLDALVLTELVLTPIFGIDASALTAGAVDFTADISEAYQSTVEGPHSIAFLLNGTTAQQVIDVADSAEVMPQKTTFYYPKLATGMVYNLLDEHSL
jgi:uncharacterized protein (DUF1015 family)